MPSRPLVRSVQDMSTATKGYPPGSMRVSDADRDRAIAELSEHYQAGRITNEEFKDRSGRALQARTTADLADLFTDLPRRQAPATGATATGAASTAPVGPARAWPARVPVAPVTILAVIAVLALLSGHLFHIAWVPVVAIIVVRLLAGGRDRRDRRDHRDGRHLDHHGPGGSSSQVR